MTSTIRVYRIEHPIDGYGPYNSIDWDGQDDMSYEHNSDGRHTHPIRDPKLGPVRWSERCGCDSAVSLLTWFSLWLDRLADAGFQVVVLDVPSNRVKVGRHGQAVYEENHAREVERHELAEFVEHTWATAPTPVIELFSTKRVTHLVDKTNGYTACGRRVERLTGYSGVHMSGPLFTSTDCGSCKRTEFGRDMAEAWSIKMDRVKEQAA